MEKNPKLQRRSQLTLLIIVLVALTGVLVINTDRASAVKANSPATSSLTKVESTAQNTADESTGFYTSAAPSLFKIISALVVVIICIYAGVYLLKRMMGKKYTGNRQHNLLEVIETTYVAPKKSVTLLRVAEKSVLVGMSENQITVLTELDADQTREVLDSIQPEQQPEHFGSMLRMATDKIKEFGLKKTKKTALET